MPNHYDASVLELIRRDHDRSWMHQQEMLKSTLEKMPLAGALEHFTLVHLENEFIEDDGVKTRYYPCVDETDLAGRRRFIPQIWPLRAKRSAVGKRGLCALDIDDLRRQQRGLQFYFALTLNRRRYHALPNPSPFALFHTTIASKEHESQSWYDLDKTCSRDRLRRTVEDLFDLASKLNGWTIFYNDLEAGATIDHLHYHVAKLPSGHGPLPIQDAAGRVLAGGRAQFLRFGGDQEYPLTVFRYCTGKSELVDQAGALLTRWTEGDRSAARFNLIAATESDEVVLYIVLRNRLQEYVSGFPYRIGSMEVSETSSTPKTMTYFSFKVEGSTTSGCFRYWRRPIRRRPVTSGKSERRN